MFAGTIRRAGAAVTTIVSDVWAAATRTLTAFTGQPRTDLVGSDATVWGHATRTLTDISAEEIFDLPEFDTAYTDTAVTSSATPNTFGGWGEIFADVGVGKRALYLFVTPRSAVDGWTEIEIGEGGAGAEVAITRIAFQMRRETAAGHIQTHVYPVWRALTDNARLSARAKDIGGATTYDVGVINA